MTRARDIANLFDANGDIVVGALDNVPASNDASALTTGTLAAARLPTSGISASAVDTGTLPSSVIDLAANYLFTGRLAGDIPHGMAGHDNSTSFNASTRLQGLANVLSSSDVTVSTANNRLTPTVAGTYFCCAVHSFNGSAGSGYTPYVGLRKSGSVFVNSSFIESYASGHTEAHITIGIQHFNGSSEYLDSVHNHNAGTTMTSTGNGQTFMFRIKD